MEQHDARIARNRLCCLLNKVDVMRLLTWMGVSMIVSPKGISCEENNSHDSDRHICDPRYHE